MTSITIELPDTIAQELGRVSGDVSRRVVEAVALDGYRSDQLSRGDVAQLLGLSWHEAEQFLAEHGLRYRYAIEDLHEDRQTLNRILQSPS